MKKYRNFIITIFISGIIGGIVGRLSGRGFTLNLDFITNIYENLFKIFLTLEVAIASIVVTFLVNLKLKYKSTDLQSIPKSVDNKINITIHLSTVSTILAMTWMAVSVNKNTGEVIPINVLIVTGAVLISTLLQTLSVRIYNKFYPERKLNMFENNSDKNYFNKLDEGEKWIAYSCSYKSFKGMQLIYVIVLVSTILVSFLVDTPIILPIIVSILWIIQISIYTIEAQKYND